MTTSPPTKNIPDPIADPKSISGTFFNTADTPNPQFSKSIPAKITAIRKAETPKLDVILTKFSTKFSTLKIKSSMPPRKNRMYTNSFYYSKNFHWSRFKIS
ncbi:hypothetical protein AKJ52_01050 [candidate division MSBL1 archaeon SCGC-AAA382C18]|uniref:Uncharacterized protein n=1 Tax=candidate division MSBL1 archaeon SCGC-AAA382C18 TaxID=1698281 RepID=A0A133VKT7_9EURY|nr:hypothetical protein AKJ52_01050 [candidate division MSBL1 archaeon SCGC-AAA382C18]